MLLKIVETHKISRPKTPHIIPSRLAHSYKLPSYPEWEADQN